MESLLEKGIYTTLGVFLFMQEKVDESVRDLVNRGRLAPEEGRRFVNELNEHLKHDSQEVRQNMDKLIQRNLKESGFVTAADIEQIKLTLSKIDERLTTLEKNSR